MEYEHKIPRPLLTDAYTGGSVHVSQEAHKHSLYHITPRKGLDRILPFATDDRLIVTGINRLVWEYIYPPITQQEIDLADEFYNSFHAGGTKFRWNKGLWQSIVTDLDGRLPIEIEAVPEGRIVFPYEPVVQIHNTLPGYGEIAAHFESTLIKMWAPMERATTLKWWQQYLINRAKENGWAPEMSDEELEATINFMFHDFGDRASSCPQESEILGMAHLLIGPGTDTTAAAYLDWLSNGKQPYACSIHALAHRTVMGFEHESECHKVLYDLGKSTGITAHVSDTYDFKHTVRELCQMVKNDPNGNNIVVIRPDSGDAIECVKYILATCEYYGLYKTLPNGLKMSTRVRWIEGDSMDFESMKSILTEVEKLGWSPLSGGFGIGGALRNNLARDHTGLSMKLAEVGNNRPTVKKSETPAKSSIPGKISLDLLTKTGPSVKQGGVSDLKIIYSSRHYMIGLSNLEFDNNSVRNRIKSYWTRTRPSKIISDDLLTLRSSILEKDNW